MIKIFYILLGITLTFYLYNKYEYRNIEVSYNENGNKIVKVLCSEDFECKRLIGKECEELGYSVFEKNTSYQLAECGKDLDLITFFHRKIIKILN